MRKRTVYVVVGIVSACCLAFALLVGRHLGQSQGMYSHTWECHQFGNTESIAAIACNEEGLLFVSFDKSGMFRSTDYGQTWTPAGNGIERSWIRSIRIHPDGTVYAGGGRGIYRSRDKGGHWALVNDGLTDVGVETLAIDGKGRVYAHTAEHRLYRKENDAAPWKRIDSGKVKDNCHRLALDSENNIYVGTYQAKLFRSADDGATWGNIPIQRPGGRYGCIDEIVVAPSGTIFIRDESKILRLRTGDRQWGEIMAVGPLYRLFGHPKYTSLAIGNHGRLLAAAYAGLFAAESDGDGLFLSTPVTTSPPHLSPTGISRIAADSRGQVYASAGRGNLFCGVSNDPMRK